MPKTLSYLYHFNCSCGSGNNSDLYGHVAQSDSNISANQAADITDQYQLCWDVWVLVLGSEAKTRLEAKFKGLQVMSV